MKTDFRVRPFDSRLALNDALTERLAWELEQTGRGAAAIMLSGGTTPLQAYGAIAARPMSPPQSLEIFYSDERYVPVTSDANNYRATRQLLEALALPAERTLRVRTELPLDRAVEDYERRMRALLRGSTKLPFGILGLGADGHTASLFTDGDLKRAAGKLAVAVQRPDGRSAVSVTPDLLKNIGEVIFIVAGLDKRTALKALIGKKTDSIAARAVAACPNVEIWADKDALPPPE